MKKLLLIIAIFTEFLLNSCGPVVVAAGPRVYANPRPYYNSGYYRRNYNYNRGYYGHPHRRYYYR